MGKAVKTITAAAVGAALLSASVLPAAAQSVTVVDAKRVFDGKAVIDNARLVLRDGRVEAVGSRDAVAAPQGADHVDLGESVVIPGLVAAHSHVGMVRGVDAGGHNYNRETVAKDLAQFQHYGVTVVNALGMNGPLFHDLRLDWRQGRHGGADLYGAGGGVGATGGAPPASMNPPSTLSRPTTPDEARAAVDQMADAGVDLIKVWVDDLNGQAPRMSPEIYAAAIDQAHKRGLKAAAHIHALNDAKGVVRAGADIIGHGVRNAEVDDELIEMMKARGVWYIATVNLNEAEYIYADHPEWLDDPFFAAALNPDLKARLGDPAWRQGALERAPRSRATVEMNLRNLRRVHEAGVKLAFGTDSGATPLRIPGVAEHLELAHLVSAGMTPVEALQTATSASAELMGLEGRGCLQIGCVADLVVLEGDPTADILQSRSISAVWRNGAPVELD